MDSNQIKKLRRELNELKAKKASVEGMLQQIVTNLVAEFGVKTLEEAEVKLEELQKDCLSMEKNLSTEVSRIEKEYQI
jgi:predicted  nucleic acid-binding Zn-ribbon protein